MGLTLLLGGARSGKSALAVRMAAARPAPVVFVATGAASDEEMAARIARHRAERPPAWETIEERADLGAAISGSADGTTVIVDCLTLWLANVLDRSDDDIDAHAQDAARAAAHRNGLTVVVSNEVGSGIVPVNPLARRYRDRLGRVNSIWAEAAAEAWLVVAGRLLRLSPPGDMTDA